MFGTKFMMNANMPQRIGKSTPTAAQADVDAYQLSRELEHIALAAQFTIDHPDVHGHGAHVVPVGLGQDQVDDEG